MRFVDIMIDIKCTQNIFAFLVTIMTVVFCMPNSPEKITFVAQMSKEDYSKIAHKCCKISQKLHFHTTSTVQHLRCSI